MRIPTIDGSRGRDTVRRRTSGQAGDAEFADHLGRAPESGVGQVVAQPSVGAVGTMLGLQEVANADRDAARNRARKHGSEVLDHLDAVRLGILDGSLSRDRLLALARLLRLRRPDTGDPELEALVQAIELRAHVEIAKLSRGA